MLESMPGHVRAAFLAAAALTAFAMGLPGEQALALGVLSNLCAGLAFSVRSVLGEWKGVAGWALVWTLAAVALWLLLMWPLSTLMASGSLHAALGVSAVVGLSLLLLWRYADVWRMKNVSATEAFKEAAQALPGQAWSWPGLRVGASALAGLLCAVVFAWPGVLEGQARWVAAAVAGLLIPALHFFKRPAGLVKAQTKTPGASMQKQGFASNAEKVELDDWPALSLSPVADAASVLPASALKHARPSDAAEAAPVAEAAGIAEIPAAVPLQLSEVAQAERDAQLYEAARAGRVERALALLAEGAQATALPGAAQKDQRSLAVLAAVLPDLRLLRALIERGADLNPEDAALAPLAVATRDSWHGRPEAVATLLANGADARRADPHGNTALHHAAHSTDPAVAALLLDAHADINAVNHDGVTPLYVAAKSGNWRVAKFLIERGAKLNLEGAVPALNAAARCDDDDAAGVELFIKHKARLDATDLEGCSPLHMAARMGHIGIFQALVDHGMSLTARDGNGRGVVHHAVEGETSADFVQELLHMGARADFADIEGFTPLHRAQASARWAVVSVLDPDFKPSTAGTAATPADRVPYAVVADALASGDRAAAKTAARGLNPGELARLFEEQGMHDAELAQWLLLNGVDPHAVSRDGQSLAAIALLNSVTDPVAGQVAEVLFARGAQANGRGVFARYLAGALQNAQPTPETEHHALAWLERGADAFGPNSSGESPLHLAIKLGWSRLVHELLARGVYPNAQNAEGMTALHLAIARGDRGLVKALIAAGATPGLRANDGQTAHGLALARGRRDLIEWVDWRLWRSPGRRLRAQDLPAAAISGDLRAVNRLLELGFDVNVRDGHGCTALLRAAGGGHIDVLEALLAHGADPGIAADSGATPLSAAVSMRNLSVVERLVSAGADVEQRLPGDVTVLMLSCALGQPKMAALLLRQGARVDAVDAQGLTAIHCACLFAFGARDRTAAVTLMDTLLLAGAEPDPAGGAAIAPVLMLLGARAEPGASTDETVILSVLDQFLAEGASLDVQDARGFGPLHIAALHGLMRVIKMLLRAGADPEARDSLNRTPREVALMRGFVDVATELGTREVAGKVSMASFLRTPHQAAPED